jgi:hypothetical protein
MRRLLLAAAASLAFNTWAHAQTGWTAPSGQFSLSFPQFWGVVPEPGRPREVLEHFGQTTALVERKECYIDVLPVAAYAGLDQSAINETVANWSERDALEVLGFRRLTGADHESFETANVDGVQVATLHWSMAHNGNTVRTRQRVFVLTREGVAQRFGIHCILLDRHAPTNDVDALLASLHFPH